MKMKDSSFNKKQSDKERFFEEQSPAFIETQIPLVEAGCKTKKDLIESLLRWGFIKVSPKKIHSKLYKKTYSNIVNEYYEITIDENDRVTDTHCRYPYDSKYKTEEELNLCNYERILNFNKENFDLMYKDLGETVKACKNVVKIHMSEIDSVNTPEERGDIFHKYSLEVGKLGAFKSKYRSFLALLHNMNYYDLTDAGIVFLACNTKEQFEDFNKFIILYKYEMHDMLKKGQGKPVKYTPEQKRKYKEEYKQRLSSIKKTQNEVTKLRKAKKQAPLTNTEYMQILKNLNSSLELHDIKEIACYNSSQWLIAKMALEKNIPISYFRKIIHPPKRKKIHKAN
ncbi:MAG: hypothetical protein A2252_04510 [Elusimicrobia bacterium RIFOXYA2_FULL_39_19]|nr:MAG: hypothetical protein A2252_04510 [Elusimicrobia bacterium RIFOXYA2_FULL_39_19]